MSLESVRLSQLRTLVAIADCGNFSEAALKLGISQSAVSHAIASLEEELGVVLLSRGRHGATLTPVGHRILAHAQEMLRLLEQIGREANVSKGLEGGNPYPAERDRGISQALSRHWHHDHGAPARR